MTYLNGRPCLKTQFDMGNPGIVVRGKFWALSVIMGVNGHISFAQVAAIAKIGGISGPKINSDSVFGPGDDPTCPSCVKFRGLAVLEYRNIADFAG